MNPESKEWLFSQLAEEMNTHCRGNKGWKTQHFIFTHDHKLDTHEFRSCYPNDMAGEACDACNDILDRYRDNWKTMVTQHENEPPDTIDLIQKILLRLDKIEADNKKILKTLERLK